VRATALVLKSYQAGNLPPAIVEIKSLSGKAKLPDLAELKEVLNMQRLVQCIEYIYFNSEYDTQNVSNLFDNMAGHEHNMGNPSKYPAARRRFPDCLQEGIPGAENATIDSFRDGFFRAMYRLLLASAVLARAYLAPVFQARKEGNARFYKVWGDNQWWSEEMDNLSFEDQDPQPREADLAYIRQYPVYNFDVLDSSEIGQWRNKEYETCFAPFATWLIEDGRQRKQKEPQDPNETTLDWAENRTDIGAVRELMLLLVAYEHFNHCFQSSSGPLPLHMQKQANRTVSIVRFGIFQVEQVTIPAAIEDLTHAPLATKSHPTLEDTAGKDIQHQIDIEQIVFDMQTRTRTPIPFHYEHQGPPGTLELWRFALRHYLNLTFRSKTFWIPPDCDCIWWREVGRGEIFLNPNWNVVQKYDPTVVSWDWRNY